MKRLTPEALGKSARACSSVARWAERQKRRVEASKNPMLNYGELREYITGLIALGRLGERLARLLAAAHERHTGEPPRAA